MQFNDAILRVVQNWLDDYAETLGDRLNSLYEDLGEPDGFWEVVDKIDIKPTLGED